MCKYLTLTRLIRNQCWWPHAKHYVTATTKNKPKKVLGALAERPDPTSVKCDYIGPPDPISNLRPYVRHYDENETDLARKLRLKRIEVEAWNTDFWTKHNKRFYEEKADFIRINNININDTDDLAAERMSIFYKSFLDKNRRLHFLYNLSWYLKNFDLLTLAFIVSCQKLLTTIKLYHKRV